MQTRRKVSLIVNMFRATRGFPRINAKLTFPVHFSYG